MLTRILLVDDHQMMREGLKSLLGREPGLEVVGEARNGREAIAMVAQLTPDVVVMDIGMRELNGIDATRRITEMFPGTRVVALTTHSDRTYVSDMLKAGAVGYVLKSVAFEELIEAIRTVAAGHVFLSSNVADLVVDDYVTRLHPQQGGPAGTSPLSSREREVLQLIAEGKSTKEVASILGLSSKTVDTHRRQIMEKIGIYSVAGLVKFAVREGIASIED